MSGSSEVTKVVRVFISGLCACLLEACIQRNLREAGIGYRCHDNTYVYRNISVVSTKKCTQRCVHQSDCVQLNHNHVGGYCLLFSSFCTLAQPDEEFTMQRFMYDVVSHDECARWVAFPGYIPGSGVIISGPDVPVPLLLARGEMSDWVIPGKLYSGSLALWSVYDDKATHVTRNVQYLDIHHSCFGVWVPYNASLGIELPHGAVKGGWLPGGSPLYVAKIFHDEQMRSTLAYYNPSVSKAIGTVGGTFTRTIMDILVLKWLNCLIHEQ